MTDNANVNPQLARAVRRQRGKIVASTYLAEASAVMGHVLTPSDLIPLDLTDQLFHLYSEGFSACRSGNVPCLNFRVPSGRVRSFPSVMRLFGARIEDPHVLVFGRLSEFTGALRLRPTDLFSVFEDMLQLEVDDLRVSSVNGICGLLIDHLERENELEIWLWGQPWLAAYDVARNSF